jgi:hypothetical protein
MKATIRSATALTVACACLWSAQAFAQDNGWTGNVGNWTDFTWQFGAPPIPDFDARGIVGSTSGSSSPVGTTNVGSDIRVSNPSPTVVLGNGAGTNGTLNITASGKFAVVTGTAGSVGDVNVDSGIGNLNVAGVLEVAGALSSPTSGNAASTTTLSGSAMVTASSGFFDNRLVIDGSNVSASFADGLVLGQSGTHSWQIPAAGASTLLVGGNADLGGTLKLTFPGGTPAAGSTWNLVDSATVDSGEASASGFSSIDQSAVVGLVAGATFAVHAVADAGSTNGTYTQLSLEQHPVLVVDRGTGTASIRNFNASSSTVAFDNYVIGSAMGSLNEAGWTSIAPADDWVKANPSASALSELKITGSTTIAASGSIEMGTPIVLPTPTAFGQENEDITFRFAKPEDSTFTQGRVVYTGVPNSTLTLNVDPSTGEAQIVNGTNFTVSIDNYEISSQNGSLKFANGAPADAWNSLHDQGMSGGNWYEANPSSTRISELLVTDGMVLAPNATVNLGSPFNDASGVQDLVFQFALVVDSTGDFNNDGRVNAADYTVWRNNLGAPDDSSLNENGDGVAGVTEADYGVWKSNFGNIAGGAPAVLTGKVLYGPLVTPGSGGLATAAVPEPGTATLALIWVLGVAFAAVRRRPLYEMVVPG